MPRRYCQPRASPAAWPAMERTVLASQPFSRGRCESRGPVITAMDEDSLTAHATLAFTEAALYDATD